MKARDYRFFTDSGIEVPAVTTDQMQEVDRIAIEETGPNLFQMMENAGRNLALLTMEILGQDWEEAKIVVLAGSGGNGGGGICAARHLANHGAHVALCLATPDRLAVVPAFQRKIFQGTSGKEVEAKGLGEVAADFVLDALIGYSLRSAPRGVVAELIQWANGTKVPILSLDVPSGVDSTTGQAEGEFIKPRWTMTLGLPKTGLSPEKTGNLFLADIGIPEETYRRMGLTYTSPFRNRYRVPLNFRWIPESASLKKGTGP
ncbi:MAG: NAD(P)H-hydrate epimerase [candidate division NC10 bacterium]|jgi:NAD(P)H-hydrate epimerase